jgi:hypothetical protein
VTPFDPQVQSLLLFGGSGGNAIHVRGTRAGMQVYLYPGSGANTITIGDAGNTVASVHGGVSVIGGPTDTLTVNDQGTTAARSFTPGPGPRRAGPAGGRGPPGLTPAAVRTVPRTGEPADGSPVPSPVTRRTR